MPSDNKNNNSNAGWDRKRVAVWVATSRVDVADGTVEVVGVAWSMVNARIWMLCER